MSERYNYKFVRIELKEGWSGKTPQEDYHQVVHEHAEVGWRLVTIFAPATAGLGAADYFELIFERAKA